MTVERSRNVVVRADHGDRASRAWRLRAAGMQWDEIAETVGYANDSNAIRAVKAFFGTLPTPDRELTRAVWRERHERLWRLALEDAEANRTGALRAAVPRERCGA